MGAAYVVLEVWNQACGLRQHSEHVRKLLQVVESTIDGPLPCIRHVWEWVVELQVLKRGTLFGPRARNYIIYKTYESIDENPAAETPSAREKYSETIGGKFANPVILNFSNSGIRATSNAQRQSAPEVAFEFSDGTLAYPSNWANAGTQIELLDFQIWCGTSHGRNQWLGWKGTYLGTTKIEKVADVAPTIMEGAGIPLSHPNLKKCKAFKFFKGTGNSKIAWKTRLLEMEFVG